MKRFLVFSALFPPIALAVFTAPDSFKNFIGWLWIAYAIALIPAWLLAWLDYALSRPVRLVGTTIAGAILTGAIASFLWGGSREIFPTIMSILVGAIPAAVCSWLSREAI